MAEQRVILCPGQGAQRVGMGRAWFDADPQAAQTFGAADEILADRFDKPLSELCFSGPSELLNRTDVAQPALFTVGVACFQGWLGDEDRVAPLATAGLSLGEYTALHVAGALSFEDGLRAVALRGRAMQEAAEASPGAMVALTGADAQQARDLCDQVLQGADSPAGGDETLVPANFNAPGQIVISGSAAACERAIEAAQGMGLRAARLPVAGAFHSPLMQPAADRLAKALERIEIRPPACPVLANATGRPHGADEPGGEASPAGVRQRLVEQLTTPVRWEECCRWLVANARGAYHELAPGSVLAGLMRRIDRSVKVSTHDRPESEQDKPE